MPCTSTCCPPLPPSPPCPQLRALYIDMLAPVMELCGALAGSGTLGGPQPEEEEVQAAAQAPEPAGAVGTADGVGSRGHLLDLL